MEVCFLWILCFEILIICQQVFRLVLKKYQLACRKVSNDLIKCFDRIMAALPKRSGNTLQESLCAAAPAECDENISIAKPKCHFLPSLICPE